MSRPVLHACGMSFQLESNLAKEYNGRYWFILLNSLNSVSGKSPIYTLELLRMSKIHPQTKKPSIMHPRSVHTVVFDTSALAT